DARTVPYCRSPPGAHLLRSPSRGRPSASTRCVTPAAPTTEPTDAPVCVARPADPDAATDVVAMAALPPVATPPVVPDAPVYAFCDCSPPVVVLRPAEPV